MPDQSEAALPLQAASRYWRLASDSDEHEFMSCVVVLENWLREAYMHAVEASKRHTGRWPTKLVHYPSTMVRIMFGGAACR